MQNSKSKVKTFYFLIVLLIFEFLFLNLDKAEASALSLGVYPPVLQIVADPPASVKAPISVKNLSNEPVSLNIVFKPFTANESEDGQPRYLKPSESFGENPLIFQFMQVMDNDHTVKSLNLAPGQQKDLTFHVGIRKDEIPSDYYFSILFISKPDDSAQKNASQALAGIAINTLLSISPDKTRGAVEEFSVPFFLEKGPVPFTVRVKNTGKNFFTPNGAILIKNMFGQTVGFVELMPVNILAGTTRAIPDLLQSPDATHSSLLSSPQVASGQAGQAPSSILNTPHAYWQESLLFGPYTATLTIALSDKGPIFQKTTNFVGFPVQAFAGFILVLIIILFIRNRLSVHSKA